MDQYTPDWWSARVSRITGSRAGSALGVNPWRSPNALIREMVREYHGYPSEFQGNVATQYGHDHEEAAGLDLMIHYGCDIEEVGLLVHPDYDWIAASPDGFVGEDYVVELKSPYKFRNSEAPAFESINDMPSYYAQVQLEIGCASRKFCLFHQWAPNGSRTEIVDYDPLWWGANLEKLRAFYDRYKSELDNPDHLKDARVTLDSENAIYLVDEYNKLGESIDNAKDRRAEIIEELAKESEWRDAEINGHKLTRVERKGNISYSQVVKDHVKDDVDLEQYRGKASQYWSFK